MHDKKWSEGPSVREKKEPTQEHSYIFACCFWHRPDQTRLYVMHAISLQLSRFVCAFFISVCRLLFFFPISISIHCTNILIYFFIYCLLKHSKHSYQSRLSFSLSRFSFVFFFLRFALLWSMTWMKTQNTMDRSVSFSNRLWNSSQTHPKNY